MSSLPSNEFLDSFFEKEDLIEGFQVIWLVIKDFFMSLEISGWPYNLSKNIFDTNKQFREMYPIFHGKLNR